MCPMRYWSGWVIIYIIRHIDNLFEYLNLVVAFSISLQPQRKLTYSTGEGALLTLKYDGDSCL